MAATAILAWVGGFFQPGKDFHMEKVAGVVFTQGAWFFQTYLLSYLAVLSPLLSRYQVHYCVGSCGGYMSILL